jgi:hypothetical protein
MHVIVAAEVKAQARSCLGRQYPISPCPDYPLGIRYRFVPNTADPDFSVPPVLGLLPSSSDSNKLHLKGHFFGLWSNYVVRGTGFLQFDLTIRHF